MLMQAQIVKSEEEGRKLAESKIADGSALKKLEQMVAAQGGDASYIVDPSKFIVSKHLIPIVASEEGYIERIDSLEIGVAGMHLGAGRETIEDVIDPSAGIVLSAKVGDRVHKGDLLATAHTNKPREEIEGVLQDIKNSYKISKEPVKIQPVVHKLII